MTIFDANPHPDERIEWLRAQVEEYLKLVPDFENPVSVILEDFVHWMENRFTPKRGLFDR